MIDLLRRDPAATAWARDWSSRPACSELTRIEVLRGMRAGERGGAERLLVDLDWVAVTESIARRAGELGRTWWRSHPLLAVVDLVVAATALELGQPLATSNVRDFPMFTDLAAPY